MIDHVQGTIRVAGVDVGGPKKGFHVVALRDGQYLDQFAATDARNVADWCRRMGALAIGVDAPCRWRTSVRPRPAEIQLVQDGIRCFFTPTLETAETHPGSYFGWIRCGAALFEELEITHALFSGRLPRYTAPVCFETFPQAIACALTGTVVSAKKKRALRRELLRRVGIDAEGLPNIDMVDAALCAVTAHYFLCGRFVTYGEENSGYIVVPCSAARNHDAPRSPFPP